MKTLAEIQKRTESAGAGGGSRKYVSIGDGEAIKFRFRQELAEDGTHYSKDTGVANLVGVHKNPNNFKRAMACTIESGRCWACEQVSIDTENGNKWRSNNHLLINVGVQDENGAWTNQILDQGFSKSHVGNQLIEFVLEAKTTMEAIFKFKRSGKGTSTEYFLIMVGATDAKEPKELAALPLEDLVGARYRVLDYEDQEAFMLSGDEETAGAGPGKW